MAMALVSHAAPVARHQTEPWLVLLHLLARPTRPVLAWLWSLCRNPLVVVPAAVFVLSLWGAR